MEKLIEKIKEQINQIKNEILVITDQIELVRAEGDDADVGVVSDFQAKLDILHEKIEQLQKNLSVYQNATGCESVDVGCTVEFQAGSTKRTLSIVLPDDVDAQSGLISIESPIGSALYQRKKGETFEVQTPNGTAKYNLTNIKSL